MLRKDLILSKTRNLLNEFVAPLLAVADKPRRKFLRQALGAILFGGSLVVSEFARWIHDDCSDIFYRAKRLLREAYRSMPPSVRDCSRWRIWIARSACAAATLGAVSQEMKVLLGRESD